LPLAELHEGFNELDPHVIHLILVKVIEYLKEQSGDRGSLLELVCELLRKAARQPSLIRRPLG
jgi:hypothetical protein